VTDFYLLIYLRSCCRASDMRVCDSRVSCKRNSLVRRYS